MANLLGTIFRRNGDDCKMLLAAGAGAGLATAFNAPIGGAVFVLEELVRRFDTRTTIVTLGASAGAIAVARVFLGNAPDFHVEPLPYPGFGTVPIHLALGIVAGCLGVAYNRTTPRYACGCGPTPSMARGTACRTGGATVGAAGMVRPRLGWWR